MRTIKQHMISVKSQFNNCWYPRVLSDGSVVNTTKG
jgi:hypothetical protein